MIKPVLQDRALLDDVRAANQVDGDFRLWWLGQSGFLLQFSGSHLLFDPYLSDSLTRKYSGTPTPRVRMTERAIDPADLDGIQVVLSSHAHTDHMDPETLGPLFQTNCQATLICPEASIDVASGRAGPLAVVRGLNEGDHIEQGPFRITAVASAHEELERTQSGQIRFLGYVVEFGRWAVYHSGDTVLYPGLCETLRRFKISAALLPINGRGRGVAGNLTPWEAAWLGKQIGARVVIPCHYDMFNFNSVDPQAFVDAAGALAQPFQILSCGGRWTSGCLR